MFFFFFSLRLKAAHKKGLDYTQYKIIDETKEKKSGKENFSAIKIHYERD